LINRKLAEAVTAAQDVLDGWRRPPSEADRAIDNLHPRMRRDTLPPTSAFLVSRT